MRHLKPDTAAFTLLLATTMAMQLLGMHITLPALPSIAAELGSTPEATQLTIGAFFAGISVSQLAYGALTDRFGRKPVLLGGLALYVLSGLGCAFAPDIEWLIVLRAVQGLGAAGCVVVSRAMVRDLFERGRAVQMMSRIGGILAVVPMMAPLLGGWLLPVVGWRGIFGALAAGSFAVMAASAVLFGESIRSRDVTATDPRRLLANCRRFVTTPGCLTFAFMMFCASGSLFGYGANSSFVLMTVFGVSSTDYGWFMALTGTIMVVGSLLSERNARRRSIRLTLSVTVAALMLSSLAVLAGTQIATHAEMRGAGGIALMIVPMLFFCFCLSFVYSNVTAAALQPVPEISGVASAIIGSVQMLGAVYFVWLGGRLFDGTPATIGYGVAIGGTACCLTYFLFGRRHAPDQT